MEQVINIDSMSKSDVLSMTETEAFDFIVETAEVSAADALLEKLETLTETQATRLKYNAVKRFHVSNKQPSKCGGIYTLRNYFADFDGMVFGNNRPSVTVNDIVDMYLFKGTSTKVFESDWAYEGCTKNKIIKMWSGKIRAQMRQAEIANKNKREEEAEMRALAGEGSIFAVLTVMPDKTPGSTHLPREFYQVVEMIGAYAVAVKKIDVKVMADGIVIPVPNSMSGSLIEKRLTTGVFFGVSASEGYRYLRFEAGRRDTHAYLVAESKTDGQYRPIKKLIELQQA